MAHRNVTVDRADLNVQDNGHLGIPHNRGGLTVIFAWAY